LGLQRFHQIYHNPYHVPSQLSFEYLNLLIENQNSKRLHQYVDSNTTLSAEEKKTARIYQSLLNRKWKQAQEIYPQDTPSYPPLAAYHPVVQDAINRQHRSVVLAVGLSAVVPGLGKIYTGRWKDGLLSFLLVGFNAWQAYRGFRLKGFDNAYGWIFSGIGLTFYAGNLYGSAKAAKQFNHQVEENLIYRAKDVWRQHY
jgi:hypothetical protein